MRKAKAISWQGNRAVPTTLVVLLGLLAAWAVTSHLVGTYYARSPLDKLAGRFSHVDERGLHWDYPAILKAYRECRSSTQQTRLLDLMVVSRAAHLVPYLINSIRPSGFGDTHRKIQTIIRLTGHDFSSGVSHFS